MNSFCGSIFWDAKKLWYTDKPDFSLCFEKIIFGWIPCLFLWIYFPFEWSNLQNRKLCNNKYSIHSKIKLGTIGLIIFLNALGIFLNIVKNYGNVLDIFWLSGVLITYVLFFWLSMMHVRKEKASPAVSFFFTFLSALFGLPQLRTEINLMQFEFMKYSNWESCLYVVTYSVILLLFALNCFADSALTNKHDHPQERASFFSRTLMIWMYPYVWKNYQNNKNLENLWSPSFKMSILYSLPIFEKYLKNTSKGVKLNREVETFGVKQNSYKIFHKSIKNISNSANVSIGPVIIEIAKPFLKTIIIANLIAAIFSATSNQFISSVITFMLGDNFQWHGYYYVTLFFLFSIVGVFSSSAAHKEIYNLKLCLDSFLPSIIYRKAIRLSVASQKIYDTSKILDLMTSEMDCLTARIVLVCKLMMTIMVAILCMVYVSQILGINVLILVFILIVLFVIEMFIARKSNKILLIKNAITRKRLKLTQDVLNGYKILKLYAWEAAFEKEIQDYRNQEIRYLNKNKKLESILGSLWFSFSVVVLLCPVLSLVLVNNQKILNIQQIFHLIGLINSLSISCLVFPHIIASIYVIKYSLRNINKFLNSEEKENTCSYEDDGYALSIENGTFSWYKGKNEEVLRNINIHIAKKKLVAVIGSLGSGKTSLLLAFMDELYKTSGKLNKQGTVAYTAQQAWILNKTFRENIIMGQPFNKTFYNAIIDACALRQDVDSFPNNDLTQIGEKGINLSGGQKQRISLARAVYSDADIYLLDDTLSALDLSVANHIFHHVIGPNGLLKEKTRIIVTHSTQFLPKMDFIVMLKNQTIAKSDSYINLKNTNEEFRDFLDKFSNNNSAIENSGEIDNLWGKKSNIYCKQELGKWKNTSEQFFIDALLNSAPQSNVLENAIQELTSPENSKKDEGIVKMYKEYFRHSDLFIPTVIMLMCISYHIFRVSINLGLAYWSSKISEIQISGVTYLGILAAFVVISYIMCYVYQASVSRMCFNISSSAHNKLLTTVLKWPMVLFESIPVSKIINRFGLYLNVVDDRTSLFVSVILLKQTQVLITLMFAVYVNPAYLVMIVLAFASEYAAKKLVQKRQFLSIEAMSKQTSIISSHAFETLTGLVSVRVMKLQLNFTRKFDEKVERKSTLQYNNDLHVLWLLIQKLLSWAVLISVGVLVVIFQKQVPIEITGFTVTYLLTMISDLYTCDKLMIDLNHSVNSLRRITEYIATPCENLTEKNTVRSSWPENGNIVFKNLKVRYRLHEALVLKGLNFKINSGEMVGVIGRTGAGKTSLISSIFRITEFVNGSIEIDDVDITTISLYDLRSKLTVIPQDPVLFSGTLRLNLDPLKEHSDDKLWLILEQAHLKRFVYNLPNKLDYLIESGGENISVGQKQLICLARALLRKTKILILDEATASVDLDTDALIQSTIQNEFKYCTVLTIAHRIQTVFNYDKILVLDSGSILEYDTPSNLVRNENSVFYKLASIAHLI